MLPLLRIQWGNQLAPTLNRTNQPTQISCLINGGNPKPQAFFEASPPLEAPIQPNQITETYDEIRKQRRKELKDHALRRAQPLYTKIDAVPSTNIALPANYPIYTGSEKQIMAREIKAMEFEDDLAMEIIEEEERVLAEEAHQARLRAIMNVKWNFYKQTKTNGSVQCRRPPPSESEADRKMR